MLRIDLIVAAAVGAVAARAALASTPASWAAFNRQANRACIAASGLSRAKVMPDKASFSDRVPIELRIVEGHNQQSVIDVKLWLSTARRAVQQPLTVSVG